MPGPPSDKEFRQLQDQVRELQRRVANFPVRWTPPPAPGGTERVFTTTGATQDASNKRWVYTGRKMGTKTGLGYSATWSLDTVDTAEYTLYSLIEFMNGADGTYGNGVTQDDLDSANANGGDFDLGPIPIGTLVRAFIYVLEDGSQEWLIDNLPNGIPGVCEP